MFENHSILPLCAENFETTVLTVHCHMRSRHDLLERVQASEEELEKGLVDLEAVKVEDMWYILDTDYCRVYTETSLLGQFRNFSVKC